MTTAPLTLEAAQYLLEIPTASPWAVTLPESALAIDLFLDKDNRLMKVVWDISHERYSKICLE